MGWYYTPGATRRDIIDELTKEQTTEGRVFRTLRGWLQKGRNSLRIMTNVSY